MAPGGDKKYWKCPCHGRQGQWTVAPRPGTIELNPYCPLCKVPVAKKLFLCDWHGKALTKAGQQLNDEQAANKKAKSKARMERRRKAKTETSDDDWNKQLAELRMTTTFQRTQRKLKRGRRLIMR